MKIRKFTIKNYRNLKGRTIDFENLTVFIGKNNIGKSNILKALDLFFNWTDSQDYKEIYTDGGNDDIFENITNIKDYRLFYEQKSGTIELTCVLELNNKEINSLFPEQEIKFENNQTIQTIYKQELGNLITVSKHIIGKEDKKAIWKIKRIEMRDLLLYKSEGDLNLVRNGNGIYKHIERRSGGIYIYISIEFLNLMKEKFRIIPAVRDIKEEVVTNNDPVPNGEYVVNSFFRYRNDASLDKRNEFEEIQKHVMKIFPEHQNIESRLFGEAKRDLYFDKFSSSSVGNGIKQIFDVIFFIESSDNVIFGVEEPEIHLHAKAQRKVFKFLKEQSKNKQLIITTHSSIFANPYDKTNLYLVTKEQDNSANIKLIDENDDFKSIKYELGAKNSDLFFSDCVVLIEGDTEEKTFPIIADAMGYNFAEKGIMLINIEGNGNVKKKKIKEFLRYLKNSDVIIYLILDKGDDVQGYVDDIIRGNLLKEGNYRIWENGDFEDCFSEEYIIKAMKNIYNEEFDMTTETLKQKRKEGRSTVKILKDYIKEKDLRSEGKPELGKYLALLIKEEIETSTDRQKTEIENVIEKIVKIVDSDFNAG